MLSIEKKKRVTEESIEQLAQYFGQELLEKGFSKGDLVTAATIIIDQAIKSNSFNSENLTTSPSYNQKLQMVK
ncbi:MAG: hypothetical protein HOD92_19375 [Deltaproteobacteria bacterium]|jgi:hypothetical protein|nr:hypothetical protein [Deltaproteobacteria bacterium]MBT4526525.1 hypothetical protein [Deltaproteobacteria bacterium]